jgi:hypothetical protein
MVDVRFALLLLVGASCGARAEPVVPGPAAVDRVPTPQPRRLQGTPPEDARPRYLVGEVCFTLALRVDHFFPLFAGGDVEWTADESVARVPLTEAAQHFNVLGFDGARHGGMVTVPDGVPTDPRGFLGVYRGVKSTGPCSVVRPDGKRMAMWDCAQAGGCGIAVAYEARTSPPPAPPAVERVLTDLCVVEGKLIGDLDGDGAAEIYSIDGFRDDGAIQGSPYTGAPCNGRFAWYRVVLGDDMLDVLGTADLDQDGRLELLIAYTTEAGSRWVALYTPAPAPVARLERRATISR